MLGGSYRHGLLALPKRDSGHAMVFRDLGGQYKIAFHENNCRNGAERAAIYDIKIEDGEVIVYEGKKAG